MNTLCAIGGLAALLLYSVKKKGTSGVGKIRPFKALSQAQQGGVKFGTSLPKKKLTKEERKILERVGKENGYTQTWKSKASGKDYPEAVYTYLNNKYNSVAGIGDLPYEEYIVRNGEGDVVVIYKDYESENILQRAINFVVDNYCSTADPEEYGYWNTVVDIAQGRKFVWKSDITGGVLRKRGMEDELFGRGHAKEERLRRISMLATPQKGGVYPEKYAYELSAHTTVEMSDADIKNGVLEALREFYSPKDAQRKILYIFYDSLNSVDYEDYFKYYIPDEELEYEDALKQMYNL